MSNHNLFKLNWIESTFDELNAAREEKREKERKWENDREIDGGRDSERQQVKN